MIPVPYEMLEALVVMAPEPAPKPDQKRKYRGGGQPFDLDRWIVDHGLQIAIEKLWGAGRRMVLEVCPFNIDHTDGSAVITQAEDGKLGFKCHHNSCEGKHWRDVRELLEPGAYDRGNASGQFSRNGHQPASTLDQTEYFQQTDLGNAELLVAQHGQDLRYCHPWDKWLAWNGRQWAVDETGEVYRRATQTVRSMYVEAANLAKEAAKESQESERKRQAAIAKALLEWARKSESRARIEAMIKLAESRPGIPVLPAQLDTDPWLLNCLNGTITLKDGELREHKREDLITKLAPTAYDETSGCRLWLNFLHRIMGGNQRLIEFLRRAIGYSLTGDVSEQILFIFYGTGANGKSTLLIIVMGMLGDYAMKATSDLLMVTKGEKHPTERADLFGRRLVAAVESEEGGRLAESFIKEATGGDPIKARRMREDFWQFDPTHKIILATNHKPVIRGTDHAIWRRQRLVPFTVTIPEVEQDKNLAEKLKAEYSGILAWAIQGCLDWQRDGLGTPDEVLHATDEYRKEMDPLTEFLAECCVIHPEATVTNPEIWKSYCAWTDANGEKYSLGRKTFAQKLELIDGVKREHNGRARVWKGIGLLAGV